MSRNDDGSSARVLPAHRGDEDETKVALPEQQTQHYIPQAPASQSAAIDERVWSVLPQSIETTAEKYLWIASFAAGGFAFGVLVMMFLVG